MLNQIIDISSDVEQLFLICLLVIDVENCTNLFSVKADVEN